MKKELLKVAAVCVLSVGMFSAAFVGFNQLTFAAATSETVYLPPSEAVVVTLSTETETEEAEADVFVPPVVTITVSPWQQYQEIPAAAMSPEEAALVGAQYIWDVFGTCIDGAQVEMLFTASEIRTNTWWVGRTIVSGMDYNFTINGITGERIDIFRHSDFRRARAQMTEEEREAMQEDINRERRGEPSATFNLMVEIGWWHMSIDEQVEFTDAASEVADAKQIATQYITRHFNLSTVVDVRLEQLSINRLANHESAVYITGFTFIAVDDTGREAHIHLSACMEESYFVSISTQHNDFVPGFYYVVPDGSRG